MKRQPERVDLSEDGPSEDQSRTDSKLLVEQALQKPGWRLTSGDLLVPAALVDAYAEHRERY